MQPVPPTSAASPKRHRRCRMSIATGDTRGSHPSNHETRRDGRQERRRTQIDPVLLVSPAGGGGRRRRPGVDLNPAISGEGCIGCPTPSGAGPRSYSPPLKPRVPSGTKENGIPVACELSPKGRKRIAPPRFRIVVRAASPAPSMVNGPSYTRTGARPRMDVPRDEFDFRHRAGRGSVAGLYVRPQQEEEGVGVHEGQAGIDGGGGVHDIAVP